MIILSEKEEGSFTVGEKFKVNKQDILRPWDFAKFDGKVIEKIDFVFSERIHFKL